MKYHKHRYITLSKKVVKHRLEVACRSSRSRDACRWPPRWQRGRQSPLTSERQRMAAPAQKLETRSALFMAARGIPASGITATIKPH